MGWKHINGKRYYYTSDRIGKRVKTTYIGAGEAAELLAEMDRIHRLEKAEARSREQEVRNEMESTDKEIGKWFDHVQSLAEAALSEAGFHKHKGQWRRKRK